MKKLILTISAAVACAMVNAASFTWMVQSGYVYNGTGASGAENRMSGTAYLFDSSAYSQSKLITDFYANSLSTITGSAINEATLTGGRVADTKFDTEATSAVSTYFAVFSSDNKSVYVSIAGTSDYDSVMQAHSLSFASVSASSKAFVTTSGAAYSDAGWYTNAPEPTSAMLLLLGFAGLALKRKNA